MQKLLPNLAISICVTAFLVLATYKISYPGLNVDELFFMNAALGDLDGTFITKKLGPIPIYSLSYLGAIKMWLYWFIFKIFNVSIISIRLPMILTSTMAVIGFFALAKKHFNERAAWMATSLLALNPTFIGATRQDYAGLEFGIQLLIFAALLGGASTALLAALCVLGLYYKISFMWWLSGILGAGLFFYPQKRRAVLISGAACAAFLLFWRWYVSFVPYVPPEFNWSGNLVRVGRIGASILEGSAFYNFLFYRMPSELPFGYYILGIIFIAALYAVYSKKLSSRFVFLALSLLVGIGGVSLSPVGLNYWHVLPFLPFFLLLMGELLSHLGKVGVVVWCLCLFQLLYMQVLYFEGTKVSPYKKMWSMAIYELISFCQEENRKCTSVDFGTHGQLLAFIRDPNRVSQFNVKTVVDLDTYYISFNDAPNNAGRMMLSGKAEALGWELELEKEIYDGNTRTYNLYKLKKPGQR